MAREQEVWDEINRFCFEMGNKGVETVILFGSRAKGNHTENSDADLCLIADDLPKDMLGRRYPAPSGYKFLSVFAFHPDEFLTMLANANPFILDIVSYGKTVYDNGFFEKAETSFHEVVKKFGLKRHQKGWSWEMASAKAPADTGSS